MAGGKDAEAGKQGVGREKGGDSLPVEAQRSDEQPGCNDKGQECGPAVQRGKPGEEEKWKKEETGKTCKKYLVAKIILLPKIFYRQTDF